MGAEGLLFRQQLYKHLSKYRSEWDDYFEIPGTKNFSLSDISQRRKFIALGRQLGKTLSQHLHEKYGL